MPLVAAEFNPQVLLDRLRTDDESALKELFHLYYDALVHFVTPMLRDQDRARDVVQDVFFKIWEKRHDLQVTNSLKAYLYMAVRNHALNIIKRENRIELNDDEAVLEAKSGTHDGSYDRLREKDLQKKLAACLDLLPPKCRQVFELSRFEHFSNKDIADTLDISVKTVENQMTKALQLMRSNLLPYLRLLLILSSQYAFF
ncbi:MAG: RNA polymerase sigma-70 factor [Bacteroidia bacterium]